MEKKQVNIIECFVQRTSQIKLIKINCELSELYHR